MTKSTRRKHAWRARLPVVGIVVVVTAGVAAAVTGAANPLPGLRVVPGGHWVYNSVLHVAFHVDGGTAAIDARAAVPGDPGSQVLQGDSSGYVVGGTRITEFGKSDLTAGPSVTPPSAEVPVGVETAGGPYLVYRRAGQVARLGDPAATMSAGGPVGDPVATADGTLWLPRTSSGLLCRLDRGAVSLSSCPVALPAVHQGAFTLVGDALHFVDTTDGSVRTVEADGLGAAVPMGVAATADLRPAANDVAGRVPVLDSSANRLYLVDPAPNPRPAIVVALPAGQYDGPVAGGPVVAVVNRSTGTLLTFDAAGRPTDARPVPPGEGTSRIVRGEDARVYVDGAQGTHVLVVGKDGKITDVPVVPPAGKPDQPVPDHPTPGQPPVVVPVEHPGTGNNPDGGAGDKPKPHEPPPPPRNPSPPAVPASPPGAPPGVSATGGDSSATVSWGAAADNRAAVTAYRISWAGGSRTVGGGTRQVEITGLANGTRYTFTVVAQNKAGTGPGASASATPAAAASAPKLTAAYRDGDASLSWTQPDLGGGQLVHYVVTGTGLAQQTVSGTTATYSGLSAGKTYTFTVRAVTRTPDGQTRTGAAASKSVTVPSPKITISQGAPTSSGNCDAPDCARVNVTMTGFAPNTTYAIRLSSESNANVRTESARTNGNGSLTYNQLDYDEPGQTVWVSVETPDGRITSNRINWKSQ
ncbi:fibronectin type III domain-containing protein [Amycolatopsis sp. OK19-0408]|uniref:Fibronectin type III domain-containing protein n=1 Tax=Amycolatopsis iheyensis TaxID=2945988 RepID=A0A9X2SQX5_9PSEU|nr:fibronectin type III domain-containing protein [Amycolatopsis iheyensis]MCR6489821.1 fibronectin type III domain-containing protein [Amycolatopsis iheyensis]